MVKVKFNINTLNLEQLESLLNSSSGYYLPALKTQVNIKAYAKKLHKYADIIYGINEDKDIIAFLAYYINNQESYITSVCVMPSVQGTGVSKLLFQYYTNIIKDRVNIIKLEVHSNNLKAISYYKKIGFKIIKSTNTVYEAHKTI